MPKGSKSKYTAKQKRQAGHIASSEKQRGRSAKTAARIAWATVNKQDHGGKLSGSGRSKQPSRGAKSRQRSNTRTATGERSTAPAPSKRRARGPARQPTAMSRRNRQSGSRLQSVSPSVEVIMPQPLETSENLQEIHHE